MTDKRFIEESFPVKEVSEISAKEKNIRHGHISTLHIWWSRKPLGSSRATSYAALITTLNSIEEWEKTRQFIIELSKWENSLDQNIIQKAREDILKTYKGKPPRVLDPFSGGGSIPLEALRLGCEVHAVEYNPVATLILKCTLEYPQKYGRWAIEDSHNTFTKNRVYNSERHERDSENNPNDGEDVAWTNLLFEEEIEAQFRKSNPLLADVKWWGNWVLEEAKKELERFYPADEDGSIPVGYYWMRTIPCQNPSCEAKIPLTANWWLAKKDNKKVALYPYTEGNEVKFKIVGDGYEKMPSNFDPENGTVSRAIAVCPVCGYTVDDKTTRKLFQQGKAGERLVAVVLHKKGKEGKTYRLANEKDFQTFKEAEKYLEEKRQKLMEEWGIDPVPDEEIPIVHTITQRPFAPRENYGIMTWGDLFNSRQKLALITFTEKVRLAYQKMIEKGYDEEYAKAVVGYLGLVLNRLADKNANLVVYNVVGEKIEHVFGRQALPMTWDYIELNVFSGGNGDWKSHHDWILNVLSHLSQIPPVELKEEGEDEGA